MIRAHRSWRAPAAFGLAAMLGCSPGTPQRQAEEAGAGPPASNLRMAERLQEIASRRNPEALRFRSDLQAGILERELERVSEASRLELLPRLAVELIRAARYEEALVRLDEIERLLKGRGALGPEHEDALESYRALAYLRLGEQENCIRNRTIESCLVPIRGGGIHRIPRGSRGAIERYGRLLERHPRDLRYRWLLNLAHMTLGEYPDQVPPRWRIPPEVFESDEAFPRFRDAAMRAGVAAIGLAGGAAMEDFDGDGLLDLMASSWGPADQLRFFVNNGDGTFSERTREAWLEGQLGGLNMVHADYDNDGDADVLVLRGAWLGLEGKQPNSLLRNTGGGRFEDVTEAAGLLSLHPTQTAAWADFDGDGWLDLFIGNESVPDAPHPCELYRNNGDGTFTDVAPDAGLDVIGFVKAAVWGDYDNDGDPDLFLSQYHGPNRLFRNDGPQVPRPGASFGWVFRDVTEEAGVAEPQRSFPAWFFDYDNDGWLDLFVGSFANFYGEALDTVVADILGLPVLASRSKLYRNRGDGRFEDTSERVGVSRVWLVMGSNFGDLDNDGWLDIYLGTGEPSMDTLVPNVALRNDRGERFLDVTTAGGLGHVQKGHGVAFGDVDQDGDEDLYVVLGGAYSGDFYPNALFENPAQGARWITLRLVGHRANRPAIGARVRVVVERADGSLREIHRVVGTGGSFGSSSLQLEIGLGEARRIREIEILWPGSLARTRLEDVPLERVLRVEERGVWREVPVKRFRLGGTE